MRIGLIGLGQMGTAIAQRLLQTNDSLMLYNRTKSKLTPFLQQGAEMAATPAELASRCDAVVTMVSDDEAFTAVVFGPEGIASGINEGAVLIDMSTLTAPAVLRAAEAVRERGADMLHAPILGGPQNLLLGSATITVGGESETFDRMLPMLEAVAKPVLHVGKLTNGTHMKMALNIMLSHLLMGVSSSLAFAGRAGLDQAAVKSILSRVSGSVVERVAGKILSGEQDVTFYLKNLEKDQRYFVETARGMGLELPTIEAAQRLSEKAVEAGLGEENYTAVYRFMLEKSSIH
ncbi:MAG TPA: NAD(P)-dependent oxidoreductase [Acidobacteriota bacterium]|nr:NAD(P)-dependent oxidoreductase [Acidobacteriota bacterium]